MTKVRVKPQASETKEVSKVVEKIKEKPVIKEKEYVKTGYGYLSSKSPSPREIKIGDTWTLISPRGRFKKPLKRSDLMELLPKGIIFTEILKEKKGDK